jgi:hypothetical protein
MRYVSVVTIIGVISIGCSNSSPLQSESAVTAPTRLAGPGSSSGVISTAAAATQLRFSIAWTVPAFPTCPLSPPGAGVITGTGLLTVVMRATSDGNGGTHIGTTIHGNGTATDETGAKWTWSDADLNNELFPSGNTSSHSFDRTITENFHFVGPKGQLIKVKGTFHITAVDGKTIVEFEKGNHEDSESCESGFVLTPLP